MPMNSDDPRVIKTRRALRDALIRLILQKGYESISIQDIANDAETARITFYRHYRGKEELLADCLNVLYDNLVEKTEQEISSGAPRESSPTRVFFQHLEDQENLYRVLFSGAGTQTVGTRLHDYMAKQVIAQLDSFSGSTRPDIPNELIAYHLVSAQIGLGIWWLEHDKPYPVEYMTEISMWLSFSGGLRALGIEEIVMPVPKIP